MLRIYNQLVMKKNIYASIPIHLTTKHTDSLHIIQNMGTRICIGMTKTMPIPEINIALHCKTSEQRQQHQEKIANLRLTIFFEQYLQ